MERIEPRGPRDRFALLFVMGFGFVQILYLGPPLFVGLARGHTRLLNGVVVIGLPLLLVSIFGVLSMLAGWIDT